MHDRWGTDTVMNSSMSKMIHHEPSKNDDLPCSSRLMKILNRVSVEERISGDKKNVIAFRLARNSTNKNSQQKF